MSRWRCVFWFAVGVGLASGTRAAAPRGVSLSLSVYATAGDVLRFLAPAKARDGALAKLRRLPVRRLFLEGRRGGEHVPPDTLAAVRDFLTDHGIQASGGIATVPGAGFGVRQQGGLGWLNWEAAATRRDVAGFFRENAPLFDTLIVDDFFCTGDTSAASAAARGKREWGAYRRDLLVSLVGPLMRRPAETAHPGVRLILKYPQWYDRFERFGYAPARMSPWFDEIWVGTEVRNPATRRMGFVQPTEGYMNFRWLRSVGGDKVRGAWFDHIECGAEHFVDQAFQSVLAGARELTLFHLGDLMADHPGDALLARRWPELEALAGKVRGRARRGFHFYKPPDSHADENLYLADYLGMLGLPVLPGSVWPRRAQVVFLGVQAAADREVVGRLQEVLAHGGTVVCTPAFLRVAGRNAAELAGVTVTVRARPATADSLSWAGETVPLEVPVDLDAGLRTVTAKVRAEARGSEGALPWLTERSVGPGRLLTLNVRTFSEADFRAVGEWLLAPRRLGLAVLPQTAANRLRAELLSPLGVALEAPAGVGFCLFEDAACLYNFREDPVVVRWNGRSVELASKGWHWLAPLDR